MCTRQNARSVVHFFDQKKCKICDTLKSKSMMTMCDCGIFYCLSCVCRCTYAPLREQLSERELVIAATWVLGQERNAINFLVRHIGCRVIENEDGAFVWSSMQWQESPPKQQESFGDWVGSPRHAVAQQGAILSETAHFYKLSDTEKDMDVPIYPFTVRGELFTVSIFSKRATALLPLLRSAEGCFISDEQCEELKQG